MLQEQEDVFYYLTVMNENYPHPALPEGAEEGILRGMHPRAGRAEDAKVAAARLRARSCARSLAAADLLEEEWGVERRGAGA